MNDMKNLSKQILLIVIFAFPINFLFQSNGSTIYAQTQIAINQKQAVEIAERFIAENGYTKQSVNRNSNLYLEEGEKASDLKNILATRLNSIEPKAMYALIKEIDEQSVWVVWFLFREEKIENDLEMGREVRVSLDGSKVWLNPKSVPVQEAKIFGDCTGEYEKLGN